MVDVTVEQEYFELVIDKDGKEERQRRVRYLVATPELNPQRAKIAEIIARRRSSQKEGISHFNLAAAVAAADEFSKIKVPTLGNRQHYAMVLRGARLTMDESTEVSGLDEHNERVAAAWAAAKNKAA